MLSEVVLRNLLWIGAVNWLVYALMKRDSRVAPLDLIGSVAVKVFGVDQKNEVLLTVQLIVYMLVGVAGLFYLISLAPFMSGKSMTDLFGPNPTTFALLCLAVAFVGGVIFYRSRLSSAAATPIMNMNMANNNGRRNLNRVG